jgi:hypothetical protein
VRSRFAGSGDLPRGRYSTLRRQASGDDQGTLLNELTAYYGTKAGVLLIYDLFHESSLDRLERFSISVERSTDPVVLFVGTPKAPSPFVAWLVEHGPWDRRAGDQRTAQVVYPLIVPYNVTHRVIGGTLDLKQQEAQRWLLDAIAANELGLKPQYGEIGKPTFLHLLPHLTSPNTGGDKLTDAIGRHLRRYGVNALIFPSARSNCRVAYDQGRCTDFHGWNMVDYRAAPSLGGRTFVDVDPAAPMPWRPRDEDPASLDALTAKGWRIDGIEESTTRTMNELLEKLPAGNAGMPTAPPA